MKILTPTEFKSKNPDAYLRDYCNYLENAKINAEKALEDAKTFKMDSTTIEGIQEQLQEILKMSKFIDEYMGQIVLKSLDILTIEELQSYFNYDEENRISDEKKALLEIEKRGIQARLEEIEKQIERNIYLNGRTKNFYKIKDVKVFFSENDTPYKFIEKLLNYLSTVPTLEPSINKLSDQLTLAIKTECKIQNIDYLNDGIICNKIIELLGSFVNLFKYAPNDTEKLSKIILSDKGIQQLLPKTFDSNTAINLIHDLMNIKKFDTSFYNSLPDTLKENLINERLQGNHYNQLLRTYQAFLKGETLPSDDLSLKEKNEKRELEKRLKRVEFDLTSLDIKRKEQKEFLADEEKMRSILREKILRLIKNKVFAKDIDSIIKPEETRLEKLKNDLKDAINLLSIKTNDLKKAQDIFFNQEYDNFFQTVELKSRLEIYNRYGVSVTDEFILPFLEIENIRHNQLDIMISLQNELDNISRLLAKRNSIISKITHGFSSSYKESIKELDEQYQNKIQEAFEKLKELDLFQVNAPEISEESTVGNVIILPSEKSKTEISDFSELSGIKQTFWNMPTGIDENTKRKFLAQNTEFENWDDYYRNLMEQQATLIGKLFTFDKIENKYYNFHCTFQDREQLKHIQDTIIKILTSIYEERKALREHLETASVPLDYNKVSELAYLLGNETLPSKENLNHYMKLTESKIAQLRNLLANNYSLCINLGFTLPEDITAIDDTSKLVNYDLEKRIQSLNIDGVTTLEEAIARRNMLLGLEEYIVPAEETKKYYEKEMQLQLQTLDDKSKNK